MPYVSSTGNVWACWSCIGGHCSLCINRSVSTTPEMQPCDCEHPESIGWLPAIRKLSAQSPVVTEHHSADTGPVPVIRQGRTYATPWYSRARNRGAS